MTTTLIFTASTIGKRRPLRMTNFLRTLISGVGASALLASPAIAQTAVDKNAPASTTQDAGGIADIVVTAQRREQRLTEVPISVQALSSKTLTRAVFTTTNDLIKLTPSLSFTQGASPGTGSVAIRGIASIAQEGGVQPSTAVVVDEVPVSRQGEFVADFGDVERIEVLRGPQGTLFGKNATAGVINIVNHRPTDHYEGSVEGGYTTDGEKLLRGMVNIPLSSSVHGRVNAYWRNQSGLLDNRATLVQGANYKKTGGSESYGVAGKIAVNLSDKVDVLFGADVSKQRSNMGSLVILQADTSPALGAIQQAAGVVADHDHPFINSDSGADSDAKVWGVSANVTARLSDAVSLKSITSYREYDNDYVTDADSGPWGAWRGVGVLPNPFGYPFVYVMEANGGLPRAPERTKYFSQEVRLNYTNSRFDILVGGFTQLFTNRKHNSVPFIGNFLGNGTLFYTDNVVDARVVDNVYSAFIDTTYKTSDTLSIFGGLRYTREELQLNYSRTDYFTPVFDPRTLQPAGGTVTSFAPATSKNNLSGRAGIRFTPSAEHSYYASFSRGYKGPATDISRAATAAKAFLKPEIATAFELGTKHQLFDNRLMVNLAVYHQTTQDIQQSALLANTTQTQLQNAGDIRAYGAELDLSGRPNPDFQIDGSVSYVHAEYRGLVNSAYPGMSGTDARCLAATGGVCVKQDLTGTRANGSPRWAASISGTYDIHFPERVPFNAFIRAGYNYTGAIQYGLTADPLLREPGHGSLDVSLGIIGRDNTWQVTIYGRNLTNEVFYSNLSVADNFIGRKFGNFTRDIRRYGGVMLKASF